MYKVKRDFYNAFMKKPAVFEDAGWIKRLFGVFSAEEFENGEGGHVLGEFSGTESGVVA